MLEGSELQTVGDCNAKTTGGKSCADNRLMLAERRERVVVSVLSVSVSGVSAVTEKRAEISKLRGAKSVVSLN